VNRYTWRTGVREGVMILIALLFISPIYVMVNVAIRPATDVSSPLRPTSRPTFDNFVTAWNESGLGMALVNSVIITVVSVTILVFLSAMAGYGIARATSRLSAPIFYTFLVGLFLPFQLGLVPLYKAMQAAGLLGSVVPLILIYIGLRMPFTVFLFVAFIRGIPIEYDESASMDGASGFQTFFRIVLPLTRPVVGTAIILNSFFTWNDFLTPLLYLTGTTTRTVPVAIFSFVGEYSTDWPLVFASLIIGILPIVIVFVLVQKTLIKGFASGIKG
jgi:raffinose/stachyose/melibiose transport system permease protein